MIDKDITRTFFNEPARIVASELQSRVVVDTKSGRRVRLEGLQPFSKVGRLYLEISKFRPGDLWTPYRRTLQSLIVVRKEEDPGSCVRIVSGSYYDPEKDQFVSMPNEGDTGNYLGMARGEIGKLRFLDNTGILYLVTGEAAKQFTNDLPAEVANRQLRALIEGN